MPMLRNPRLQFLSSRFTLFRTHSAPTRTQRILPATRTTSTTASKSRFTPNQTHQRPASNMTSTDSNSSQDRSQPASQNPIADSIRRKLTSSLTPTTLEIHNDSHLHAHHTAMRGNTSSETHFRVHVVSEAFEGKRQPARHRVVYGILGEELKMEGGVHALGIVARTPSEETEKGGEIGSR
ncbi:MAG: hypothetical protein M1831_004647 [Alyxoria varia]|nr:MAG: hypothetical protein M1831_004647 [Alyxoria varia]